MLCDSCCGDNGDSGYDVNSSVSIAQAYGIGGGIGDVMGGGDGEAAEIELRCWPSYDAHGEYMDSEYAEGRTLYLCRYLLPWFLARQLTRVGLNCGLRLSTGGLPGWALGTRAGRRFLFVLLLLALLLWVSWVAYGRGRERDAILASPCYVCNPGAPTRLAASSGGGGEGAILDWDQHPEATKALHAYASYVHGPGCALDDLWIEALDRNSTQAWRNRSVGLGSSDSPWTRYDRLLSGAPRSPRPLHLDRGGRQDWRRALPRLYLVGFRGAGTTSLSHYLDAHPEVAVRHRSSANKGRHRQHQTTNGKITNKDSLLATVSTPWDDHFFASVADWNSDELKAWVRRGWGPPTLRDHQGRGRLRVEVGPDYLWLASTGAASAVRRTRPPPDTEAPRFLVLLTDPVRLVREAHARAVDAGVEDRESLATVVGQELPQLARCLWWDQADQAEQNQRVVSGLCGGAGEPSRLGGPYLWRGLLSAFVAHWMRAASPGDRRRWYFMRAEDLLQQPNRTLNRLGTDFLGIKPHDYGPQLRRIWHPEPAATRDLAPKAPWRQSWKAYVPRTEYLQRARKRVSDALLDAAGRAVRRVVPGLETALETREKLRRLHCRLAGFADTDRVSTQRCLAGDKTNSGGKANKQKESLTKQQQQQQRDEMAEEALRDFYAPFQQQLMAMVEAVEQARYQTTPRQTEAWEHSQSQEPSEDRLREFYLGNP